ncbi:hypothetical protein D3C84_636190 [compost metagenome]
MGHLPRIVAEKLQRHTEHRFDLAVVGLVLDEVRNQPHIGRDLDAMAGDQGAERANDLHQTGGQADFFFRLAQGGVDQVRVAGIAPASGKSHFAAMGGKAAGAQGQDQLGLVAAGNRHQHRGFGEVVIGLQGFRGVALHTTEQVIQHGLSRCSRLPGIMA